jgi:RHS repeat-associated protein
VNGQTRDFIYDLSGRNIDEFTPGGSGWLGTWTRGEAYAGSLHIATYANGTTEFDNSDWLSTFRARSDVTGNVVETCTSLPFGEDLTCTGTEVTPIHFTGKEHDAESGNDFFGARYYTSTMGRFLTPDNGSGQDSGNPQSWNLYSYVMNQPTTATDPDGHDCIHINIDTGEFEGFDPGDCDNSTEEKANSGIYVDGTINTLQFNGSAGSLDFGYTDANGNVGAGTILGVAQPGPAAPINDPGMIPLMLGPGDLILFSGVKMPSVVTDAFGKALGTIFGKAAQGAGAGVEEILAKAASAGPKQTIKASSRAAAEEAAEKWVGTGARPIFRRGEQIGFESADGTKVARWTSAGKPDPYINLTSNETGGNLHVQF